MNILLLYLNISSFLLFGCCVSNSVANQKGNLVKIHLKRLKKEEGAVKLVGGRAEFEGNVEILHNSKWGAICDDQWNVYNAMVICKQLGYWTEAGKPSTAFSFGPPKRKYWIGNVSCSGDEEDITKCLYKGWGFSNCPSMNAAGVKCQELDEQTEDKKILKKIVQQNSIFVPMRKHSMIRLMDGEIPAEGRVEIKNEKDEWEVICGDSWSILEAMVVCRQLGLGYANAATKSSYFANNLNTNRFRNIRCIGSEKNLGDCFYDLKGVCQSENLGGVSCVMHMPDLIIDHIDLMRTAHLEDRQLFFLQCAMEENCLASQAYEIQQDSMSWHLETRRLLRFTARIFNAGTADFRPSIPKHLWEWHMCHMHYHSMEVFATFNIFDSNGYKVAEGHKASFCLEDNQCLPGVKPRYQCANYGDQGISINCSDIYKYTVDCQWVDISDLKPGMYTLKVAVNPEFKVPEMTFENNAAVCQLHYTQTYAEVSNCSIQRP